MAPSVLRLASDEVNMLVYSYLLDSGFQHAAFSLRNEAKLERSPHFDIHIPRGALCEQLSKALAYTEVETHTDSGGVLTTDCKSDFSLLKPHVCTVDADAMDGVVNSTVDKVSKLVLEAGGSDISGKRKANAPADGDGQGRRVKRSSEPEEGSGNARELDDVQMSDVEVSGGKGGEKSRPKAMLTLAGHEGEVFVCAWNPAKHGLLATGSKDATVRIWDLPDPTESAPTSGEQPYNSSIVLRHVPVPETDQKDITSVDWNNTGTLVASGSYDSTLRVWTEKGEFYMSHNLAQKGPVFAIRFSKSGRWLLCASLDGSACVWNVEAKTMHMHYNYHSGCCLDVDWLDDVTFATCGADKKINIMRVDYPVPIKTFAGHENEINQLKFNPSRTRIASCSDDHTARVWELGHLPEAITIQTMRPTELITGSLVLRGHTDSIGSMSWCPNVRPDAHEMLATVSFDGTSRLWDAITGACLFAFSDHKRAAYTLAFSPQGNYLATASGDGWLYIYNIQTGAKIWSYYVGTDKPGIYEIDWQQTGKLNRIALCLESEAVGIIDVTKVPELNPPTS